MLVKVYNKGQIIIPANFRKKYNINIGDKVNIIEDVDGLKIIPEKQNKSILNLAGIFSKDIKPKITDKKIEEITEKSFLESFQNEIY